ncbi:FlgB family protein [Paracoccus seriniphilus]|uniref:Flagellar basal body rod protein FlgB n=1 Tax=Paracoccus seriniphilus TaxID=184748 RepID=A0A239PSC2_9RHOB|nr:FlgB family protein [Paracoccus seriniphilus]WCR14251.1 FlgB family protein [Paracoccus seriniphilus]SNT73050.1 flagellar basal-body rod protein FlgB [Paracoccus seriniphilus]
MFEKIEMMRMARAMGQHVAQRQTVVARNIANADTPGFKAQDLPGFEESYHRSVGMAELKTTSIRHFSTPQWSTAMPRAETTEGESSPNGNSVSLEKEMLKAAEVKRAHELSLGIYQSALTLMRSSIGR